MFNKKMTTTITVEGMHCQHCADHVKDALKKIDGVKNVKVDIQTKQVEIISTKQLDLTCVENIINQLGYELKK